MRELSDPFSYQLHGSREHGARARASISDRHQLLIGLSADRMASIAGTAPGRALREWGEVGLRDLREIGAWIVSQLRCPSDDDRHGRFHEPGLLRSELLTNTPRLSRNRPALGRSKIAEALQHLPAYAIVPSCRAQQVPGVFEGSHRVAKAFEAEVRHSRQQFLALPISGVVKEHVLDFGLDASRGDGGFGYVPAETITSG